MKVNRSLTRIGIVFGKEISETLRDRRTLFVTLLLPILLYPLLILGTSQAIISQIGQMQKEKIRLVISARSAVLEKILTEDGGFTIRWDVSDAMANVQNREAELGIEIFPDFDTKIHKPDHDQVPLPRLTVYYSKADEASRLALNRLETLLRRLLHNQVKTNLQETGQPYSLLRPFRIIHKNIAKAKEEGAVELGRILAFMIVIMAVSFSLYPAIDMAAGEKERGTMETLLIAPARRFEIVLGKYLAIFTISMIGSILNLTSMGLTFGQFANMASDEWSSRKLRSGETFQTTRDLGDVIDESETTLIGKGAIVGVVLLPHHQAVSLDKTGQLFAWDLAQRKVVASFRNAGEEWSCWAVSAQKDVVLLGTPSGRVYYYRPASRATSTLQHGAGAGPIQALALSGDQQQLALVIGQRLVLLNVQNPGTADKTWENLTGPLCFSPDGQYLASCGPETTVIETHSLIVKKIPTATSSVLFSADGQHLLCGSPQGRLSVWHVVSGERVWPKQKPDTNQSGIPKPVVSPEIGYKAHDGKVTCLAMLPGGQMAVSGGDDGVIGIWKITQGPKPELTRATVLTGHESGICALDIGQEETTVCLSGGSDGLVKFWQHSKRMEFTISPFILAMLFLLMMPLTALFSALSLALSVFAKSYKEAQYYLTPLLFLVMPLSMIALIPGIELTAGRCLVPVAGIVLLYKELFLGHVITSHLLLTFLSTFVYGGLSLLWAVSLFSKESVLFRESGDIKIEFWNKKTQRQVVFSSGQALAIFLAVMAAFHFLGPLWAKWDLMAGQILNQAIWLIAFPLLLAFMIRLDMRKTFHLTRPKTRELAAAVLLALGGMVLAKESGVIQRLIFPVSPEYLELLEEMFRTITQGVPFLLIFAGLSLMPGISEEFFFRGLLLSSLRRNLGAAAGVLVTAMLFAAMHLQFPNFSFYLVMGCILGFLAIRSDSIFVPMLAHIINNGLAVVLGTFWGESWLVKALYDPTTHTPLWILAIATGLLAAGWLVLGKRPSTV